MAISKIKYIIALASILYCIKGFDATAQTIQGPSTVSENETHVYTYTDEVLGEYNWVITNGIAQTSTSGNGNGTATYSVTVWWTNQGTGKVEFTVSSRNTVIASKNITIQEGAFLPPSPPTNVTGSDRCGSGIVNLSATPGTSNGGDEIRWRDCSSGSPKGCALKSSNNSYSPSLTAGTYIYDVTTYSSISGLESSAVRITINVWPNIGSAGTISSSSTICYNSSPGQLAGTAATGGTSITYQWQKKTTGGFSNISGATGQNYTPGNLTTTTQYRRRAFDSHCATKNSNTITITVRPALTGGSISPNKTICSGSSVGTIQNITSPTGGNGSYTYEWKERPIGGSWSTWAAGGATYNPGNITTDMQYQRRVKSCGQTKYASAMTVYVDDLSVGGTLNGSTSAFGNESGSLSLQGYTGAIQKWQYKWESASTWTNVTNTTANQSYTNVDETTSYRVKVKNGACPEVNSTVATVTIYDIPNIIISGPENLVYGSETSITTDDVHYQYQWKKDGVNIPGATSNTYQVTSPGNYILWVQKTNGGATYTTGTTVIGDALQQQSATLNYVSSVDVLVPSVDENTNLFTLGDSEVALSTQYIDGLGRGMQTVSAHSSVNKKDIVQPVVYDAAGRQVYAYLPYTANNGGTYTESPVAAGGVYAGSPHHTFYQAANDKITNDTRPYSETVYENSPLNRVMEQYGPGQDWKDGSKSTSYDYAFNSANEVRLWTISGGLPVGTAYYNANELYKNTTTDEEGNDVIEFIDKQGRTVLKRVAAPAPDNWADTYYVYDDFGNLRFVLPPEAVNHLDEYND